MEPTRRQLLVGAAAATVGTTAVLGERAAGAARQPPTTETITELFAGLPGTFAFKVFAPATARTRQLELSLDAGRQLFVGSAIKAFIAVEAFRQVDSPDVVAAITEQQLTLDATVWSAISPVFNPPNLTGTVSERTTLEAMIMHSDNTATDMVLKHIGPDNVRAFLTSGQFANTLIPDSTLSFFGYLFGAPDYRTFTWDRLVASGGQPFVNPVLNTVTTLASSADDLVSLYSRALHGEFFEHDQTLNELRALLSFGDPIWVVPYPLGVSPFGKGGSIDISGTHILCVPGAMFFDDVWVYFAFILNWADAAPTDPVTRDAFLKATATSLQLVKDALAAPLSSGPTGRLPATR